MIKLQNAHELIMVDDSDIDLRIAARCLANSHVKNSFVGLHSAADLLSYLTEVEQGNRDVPALVLLDINMPMMNGFEALEKAREAGLKSYMPCVAMFSHSSHAEDRQKALECGADGYQVKPTTMAEYIDLFNSLT